MHKDDSICLDLTVNLFSLSLAGFCKTLMLNNEDVSNALLMGAWGAGHRNLVTEGAFMLWNIFVSIF